MITGGVCVVEDMMYVMFRSFFEIVVELEIVESCVGRV